MTQQQLMDESRRLWKMAKGVRANTKLSSDCKFRLLKKAHALARQAQKLKDSPNV